MVGYPPSRIRTLGVRSPHSQVIMIFLCLYAQSIQLKCDYWPEISVQLSDNFNYCAFKSVH